MLEADLQLIKLNTSHYFVEIGSFRDRPKIKYNGKTFIDKFEKVESRLNSSIIKEHFSRKIVVAHSIINNDKLENVIIDYNGTDTDAFYRKAQLLLKAEGYLNFTAYRSRTEGHLHIYIHKGHTHLVEGKILAKVLNKKLSNIMLRQFRVFPNDDVPPSFNILTLPYGVYAKERGASWSRHM